MKAKDLTKGSIPRLLVMLSLPTKGSILLHSAYSLTDLYFLGGLGGPAIAGLGISHTSFFFVLALGMAVGT